MDLHRKKEFHCITLTVFLHMYECSKCTSNVWSVSMSLTQCSPLFGKNMHKECSKCSKIMWCVCSSVLQLLLNHVLHFYAQISMSVLGQKILLTTFVSLMTITKSWSLPPLVPDHCKLYNNHHQEDRHCCNCNSSHCWSRCTLSGYFRWDVWSVWE